MHFSCYFFIHFPTRTPNNHPSPHSLVFLSPLSLQHFLTLPGTRVPVYDELLGLVSEPSLCIVEALACAVSRLELEDLTHRLFKLFGTQVGALQPRELC